MRSRRSRCAAAAGVSPVPASSSIASCSGLAEMLGQRLLQLVLRGFHQQVAMRRGQSQDDPCSGQIAQLAVLRQLACHAADPESSQNVIPVAGWQRARVGFAPALRLRHAPLAELRRAPQAPVPLGR
jgi:hypothetical protein